MKKAHRVLIAVALVGCGGAQTRVDGRGGADGGGGGMDQDALGDATRSDAGAQDANDPEELVPELKGWFRIEEVLPEGTRKVPASLFAAPLRRAGGMAKLVVVAADAAAALRVVGERRDAAGNPVPFDRELPRADGVSSGPQASLRVLIVDPTDAITEARGALRFRYNISTSDYPAEADSAYLRVYVHGDWVHALIPVAVLSRTGARETAVLALACTAGPGNERCAGALLTGELAVGPLSGLSAMVYGSGFIETLAAPPVTAEPTGTAEPLRVELKNQLALVDLGETLRVREVHGLGSARLVARPQSTFEPELVSAAARACFTATSRGGDVRVGQTVVREGELASYCGWISDVDGGNAVAELRITVHGRDPCGDDGLCAVLPLRGRRLLAARSGVRSAGAGLFLGPVQIFELTDAGEAVPRTRAGEPAGDTDGVVRGLAWAELDGRAVLLVDSVNDTSSRHGSLQLQACSAGDGCAQGLVPQHRIGKSTDGHVWTQRTALCGFAGTTCDLSDPNPALRPSYGLVLGVGSRVKPEMYCEDVEILRSLRVNEGRALTAAADVTFAWSPWSDGTSLGFFGVLGANQRVRDGSGYEIRAEGALFQGQLNLPRR